MQHKTTLITIILFLISISLHAQSHQISLTAKNAPIKTVLAEIQTKSGYRILYNDEVVPDDLYVSVNAENVAVKDLLNLMLQNTGLTFVLQNEDLLVITKKEFIETANQITGLVVDETGEPVPFANVVQLALPDSAFINGVSTAVNGRFSLERKSGKPVLLEVTYLGYERHRMEVTENNLGTIRLKPETTLLGEVVVTASRPTHKMAADGIVTSVQNTLLARLGTANDVLDQLPFVKGEDGNYTVFGRGKPLIYINNRLMRDNNELRQLNSTDIKDVKVILTPGSQYDASVGSVIRITTVKPVGEGLSGTLYTYLRQRRRFDHYEYVNLNYRKGKLDVFTTISYDKTASKQNQKDDQTLYLDKEYLTQNDKKFIFDVESWSAKTGLNYVFSPTHSAGLSYTYEKTPKSHFVATGSTHHFINNISNGDFYSDDIRNVPAHRNYLNTYYHNEFKNNTTLHFEGDYVKGGGENTQETKYNNLLTNENTLVENVNTTNYSLYAGKLVAETPLLGGKLTLGSDASFTDNTQDYKMLNQDLSSDLPSNSNEAKQWLVAGFMSFSRGWEKFNFDVGLRYEHIKFDYYLNEKLSKEQSRKYNNVFPSVVISYKTDNVNMSLSNSTLVRRPNYFNLRSSIAYNDPYTYEGGNPSLQPMYTNKLSYLFGWKDVQAEVSYNWIKDNLLFIAKQFQDKPIILFTMTNLSHSERFDAHISYSPRIGWWRPTFQTGLLKQNLTYEGRKYNKPYFTYAWNNIIQLPQSFLLTVNMRGNLQGESEVSFVKSAFRTDLRLNKRFFNNTFNLTLAANDIFATDLERWSMYLNKVDMNKWNDSDSRGVYLQATYSFNAARNKYKGQGAANEERNRL